MSGASMPSSADGPPEGMGMPGPSGAAGGAAGATIWRPVPGSIAARTPAAQVSNSTKGGAGGYPGAGGLPGMGNPEAAGPMTMTPGMSGMPGMPGMPGGMNPQQQQRSPRMKVHPRYEFVVCFIWREPTPTDPTPTADAGTGATQ
jgi:collagen type V/XI/XXIV/XXVII alpha